MQTGISTACLYPMLLEKSLSTLISMKFRNFEIFINTFSELGENYLSELKKLADESGSVIRSVHPFTSGYESFLLFSGYRRRFEDSLELYEKYFHACNILGANIMVLHGRKCERCDITDEEFFERYLQLYELGQSFGVTVAQENVNQFCSDDPAFIRKMRKACGNKCAFVLDIKQAVRGGEDPFEMCNAMGKKICHVHINDNNKASDCLLPGFGKMDYSRLIGDLKRFGYDGSLIIEVYRKSFRTLDDLLLAKKTVENLVESSIITDN